jgi:hypothetical protein
VKSSPGVDTRHLWDTGIVLGTPFVRSQEPPRRDLVEWASLTLILSSAELFLTSIGLFVAAAWAHGKPLVQFGETGAVLFGVLDESGYDAG